MNAFFPIRGRKSSDMDADIGRLDTVLFMVGILPQDRIFAAQSRVDDQKFYEKGTGDTGFLRYSREGMTPPHIASFGKASAQHEGIFRQT